MLAMMCVVYVVLRSMVVLQMQNFQEMTVQSYGACVLMHFTSNVSINGCPRKQSRNVLFVDSTGNSNLPRNKNDGSSTLLLYTEYRGHERILPICERNVSYSMKK